MFPFSTLRHEPRQSVPVPLLRYCVRIGHEREVHIRMPERVADRNNVDAGAEQIAREGMAQVVEAYLTDSRSQNRKGASKCLMPRASGAVFPRSFPLWRLMSSPRCEAVMAGKPGASCKKPTEVTRPLRAAVRLEARSPLRSGAGSRWRACRAVAGLWGR
jgi:hypothetical protein